MKTFFIIPVLITSVFCTFGQNTFLDDKVILLGEKKFEDPISITITESARKIDSCHINCNNYNTPFALLLEKKCLDSIQDYCELSVFNSYCYLFEWWFFASLVTDYIVPFIDTTSSLSQRLTEAYPKPWRYPYERGVIANEIDYGLYKYKELVPCTYLIVLMNATTYNEYLSTISPLRSFYEGTLEENGIYFKVAIPLPEEEN